MRWAAAQEGRPPRRRRRPAPSRPPCPLCHALWAAGTGSRAVCYRQPTEARRSLLCVDCGGPWERCPCSSAPSPPHAGCPGLATSLQVRGVAGGGE